MGLKAVLSGGLCHFGDLVKAYIYVDGFNLYNRALRGKSGVKWLNLRSLSERLLKNDEVVCIKYFTARVTGRQNPDAPRRQQTYLNALAFLKELKVYYGKFKNRTKRRPLVTPISGHSLFQEFHDTEEKGSDVNLASHLVVRAREHNPPDLQTSDFLGSD